jgi:murein L,D-transpeptidase YcbB/YkuD
MPRVDHMYVRPIGCLVVLLIASSVWKGSAAALLPDPYGPLEEWLHRYRAIQAAGGWPAVSAGAVLAPGARGERVHVLRARLHATGDLTTAQTSPLYDRELEDAVRRFQARLGLGVDGVVGPATIRALNVPVEARIRQIETTLEQVRSLPAMPSTGILADTGMQRLVVLDGGQQVLDMRAVAGRECRPVPVVVDELAYLIVNPPWYVPAGPATRHIVHAAREDPSYLLEHGFRVFTGWDDDGTPLPASDIDWAQVDPARFPWIIRQNPHPENPLGTITLTLRNRFDVYFNAGPAGEPFSPGTVEAQHGCIRLERPLDVAALVIRNDPQLSMELITRAVQTGRRHQIMVREPMPVYVLHSSAWVAPDGALHFRDDGSISAHGVRDRAR